MPVMMRHAVRLNSLSELSIAKLDMLDIFDTLRVCVGLRGRRPAPRPLPRRPVAAPPGDPVYEDLPGWSTDLTGPPSRPAAAAAPTTSIPRGAGRRADPLVGVGPGRDQYVQRTP
jgi:adenylosuccinate synthase